MVVRRSTEIGLTWNASSGARRKALQLITITSGCGHAVGRNLLGRCMHFSGLFPFRNMIPCRWRSSNFGSSSSHAVCSLWRPNRAMGEIRDFKSGKHGEPPSGATPRRLAAIVAGDIAGYSRLMELDEEGTHGRVKRIERDLVEPSIAEHHGRLVKTTGDGFIAIFDSPVEAVRCSIVIQQNLVGRNASLPKHSWIEYRIGVNLGDVIIETDDVYGDGVNVAARLEGIADPGQVYISGGIYEQIKHKLVCGYESLGGRKVKNITDPVRVYRVLPEPSALNNTRKRRENILIFLLGFAVLIIAGGALWYMLVRPHGGVRDQASAPVSSPAEPSKEPPAPAARQATSPTQPAMVPANQPQPSVAAKQGGNQ